MKLYLFMGSLLFSLTLTGCLNTITSQETNLGQGNFVVGRQLFLKGDYYQAFRNLEPVAKFGNPEAQYAVGYMYYYGLGTPQDREVAYQWMQAAANQGHPQAIQAVAEIQNNQNQVVQPFPGTLPSSSFYTQPEPLNRQYPAPSVGIGAPQTGASPSTSSSTSATQQNPDANSGSHLKATWPPPKGAQSNLEYIDPGMPTPEQNISSTNTSSSVSATSSSSPDNNLDLNNPPTEQTAPQGIPISKATPSLDSSQSLAEITAVTHQPISNSNINSYTVQILASYNKDSLENYIQENQLQANTSIYQVKRDNKDWFIVGYGKYTNKTDAISAIQQLPNELQQDNPWVRQIPQDSSLVSQNVG